MSRVQVPSPAPWGRNSAGECFPYKEEAAGSIPAAPTKINGREVGSGCAEPEENILGSPTGPVSSTLTTPTKYSRLFCSAEWGEELGRPVTKLVSLVCKIPLAGGG